MNEKNLQEIYSKNIRELREKLNLTQAQLAEKTGITEKYLSAIETGKKWGSFYTLSSLAEALKVQPFELLLPQDKTIAYDTRRTKNLMKNLRKNLNDLMDTLDNYLSDASGK
ncbi:helix-turn-helix transcriptional regulator [Treponema denticola]|uniref:helix-turn-helix domain-containing protein n=1 Tax=Treponema TaxID=157 RepID=UPI0002B58105|nr:MULTISPECIES: helix-turn-helix transcriptional regulator [Treponema]EMB43857.1 hypothetical protein HMPREF9729_02061 [Treponema denticola ASLM]EMD56848.1 hypothetical protein HMPREF9728_01247 [Treponema denticola US-Trep]UTC87951.1 helix-turn-helix transcriptional regulator [Treponema denticola]UTC92948.1 helix-turn-helix transcriptional regulator [Treponema denticola]UTC95482.1 helix-turn-helix transcriptional regulator [Treponema denticola]